MTIWPNGAPAPKRSASAAVSMPLNPEKTGSCSRSRCPVGDPGAHRPPPVACPQLFQIAGCESSFPEHFCDEVDDDGSQKASTSEEIYQGVACGGEHGVYYQCYHIVPRFYLCCSATVSYTHLTL